MVALSGQLQKISYGRSCAPVGCGVRRCQIEAGVSGRPDAGCDLKGHLHIAGVAKSFDPVIVAGGFEADLVEFPGLSFVLELSDEDTPRPPVPERNAVDCATQARLRPWRCSGGT